MCEFYFNNNTFCSTAKGDLFVGIRSIFEDKTVFHST